MPQRRTFTKKEKKAAAVVQDVHPDGMHADHRHPYSKNGPTDIANCQLISSRANIVKSAFAYEPRQWQKEFALEWQNRHEGRPFLLVVIPGGGKTFAALDIASRWLRASSDRRLLVIVPTQNLQEQWKEDACRFGVELQTKEFAGKFKHQFHGCAATFSTVARNALNFRALCASAPTLVISDEHHHCGDEKSWGDGIEYACEPSKEKLLLSGTPFRTDGTTIPFVTYDGNGYSVADYRYDYPSALNDDVVRWLTFEYAKGSAEIVTGGGREVREIHSGISEEEATRSLRHILNASGDFVRQTIVAAHSKLQIVRRCVPDAAALAACIDTPHAESVARLIHEVTGREPSIVVSDNSIATDTVRNFRNSSTEWIVAVRQVTEGTNIPRLQVLCYLTNYSTELFFRQLLGRVSRVRNLEDREAYVYLPADPRLIAFARRIQDAQVAALKQQQSDLRDYSDGGERSQSGEVFVSSERGPLEVVMIGNQEFAPDEADRIRSIAEETGVSMEVTARVLRAAGNGVELPSATLVDNVPQEDRMNDLGRECNKLAFRLSKILDVDVKEIHKPFPRQRNMTLAELEAKKARLIEMIAHERS